MILAASECFGDLDERHFPWPQLKPSRSVSVRNVDVPCTILYLRKTDNTIRAIRRFEEKINTAIIKNWMTGLNYQTQLWQRHHSERRSSRNDRPLQRTHNHTAREVKRNNWGYCIENRLVTNRWRLRLGRKTNDAVLYVDTTRYSVERGHSASWSHYRSANDGHSWTAIIGQYLVLPPKLPHSTYVTLRRITVYIFMLRIMSKYATE